MALERERMVHMTQGFASAYDLDMLHTVACVSFQELATRISHRNTGRYTKDPVCEQLLARIALDENLQLATTVKFPLRPRASGSFNGMFSRPRLPGTPVGETSDGTTENDDIEDDELGSTAAQIRWFRGLAVPRAVLRVE